jgi:zinc protease
LLEADDLYSREKLSEYAHTLSFWWSSTVSIIFERICRISAARRAPTSADTYDLYSGQTPRGLALISSEAQQQVKLTLRN